LELWKADLKTVNEKAAEALADPAKYPNLFPDLEYALKVRECVCLCHALLLFALDHLSIRISMLF